jgi:lysophospholipase L1-like esterase
MVLWKNSSIDYLQAMPVMHMFFRRLFVVSFVWGAAIHAAEPDPVGVSLGSRGVSNFIARIEKDRKAHVAFLGGSITQNGKGHSGKVAAWLQERWPEVAFTFTNAGLSSTCSVSGAFRLNRDVLSKGPVDLMIVEFAVNDDQDAGHDAITARRGMEGILRQYFAANPTGDAIMVQYVNPDILQAIQNGSSTVSVVAHEEVARHYGLPNVNVGAALAAEIAAGRMTWEADYQDTHPNDKGYTFASHLITRVIEATVSGETPQTVTLPKPLDPGSYASATLVDPQKLDWLGGWKFGPVSEDLLPVGSIRGDYREYQALRSDEAGSHLYFSFSGTMLGAFVLAGPDAGSLEVSIDGGAWKKVDLYHSYSKSLNYPRSVILADDLAATLHQAVIRVAKTTPEGSQGTTATILHFEVNG